jgi:CheY-like chemotaxis protein
MSHGFDGRRLHDVFADHERLLASAIAHEQRLTGLVAQLEDGTGVPGAPTIRREPATGPAPPDGAVDLLSSLRELCVQAREHRLLVETMLCHVIGDVAGSEENMREQSRVLVVDDSDDNRQLTSDLLELHGFNVVTARNGLEGVLAAHCARPAVVLMDLSMPVLSGLEATQLLKASEPTARLSVLAVTARPELCDVPPFDGMFAAVLTKPIAPDKLVSAVRQFVAPAA